MQTLSSILIGGGIIFMILSIFQTRELLGLQEGKMFKSWNILSYFIISFLLGYIGALILVLVGRMDILSFLTGMVFFAGAMFVFLVIRASLLSSKKLIETASARNYLNDIFQTMGNILVVLDENDIIKTVNPTTCEKLGCDSNSIKLLVTISAKFSISTDMVMQDCLKQNLLQNQEGKYLYWFQSTN